MEESELAQLLLLLMFVAFRLSRRGSIIVDFVVQTTEFINDEISSANKKLPAALSSVAAVIGDVDASYKSKYNETLLNEYFLD